MSAYFMKVYEWIINVNVWTGIGPFWQMIGILLFGFTILQLLPDTIAGGFLFSNKALWITLILDALWVFLVFVAPFIPIGAVIAMIVVVILIVLVIIARKHWN